MSIQSVQESPKNSSSLVVAAIDPDKITSGPLASSYEKIREVFSETVGPNPAFEIVNIFLEIEVNAGEKLKFRIEFLDRKKEAIQDMLEISSELNAFPQDKSTHEISPKLKGKIMQLERHQIFLLPEKAKAITKEQLREMKSLISAQIDQLRTIISTDVPTKIQPLINQIHMIINIVSQVLQGDARLKSKIIELRK